MKSSLVPALLFCLGLLLPPAAGADAPRRIVLASANVNYRVAFEEIARRYEEMHPGVKVEVTVIGQDFETWLRTRFAAGGDMVPDIYNTNFTVGYEREGRLVFLEDYLEQVNPYTGRRWRDSLDIKLQERYRWAGHDHTIFFDYIDIAIFYNKDIFAELGLEPPDTWAEFLELCEGTKEAGYVPVAMPGNADALWVGEMGWLVRLLGDVYFRNYVPDIMARPGDWDYDPERNADYVYDPADPYSDLYVVVNTERLYNAILDGTIDARNERFRAMYTRLKEFSQYWQPGYLGSASGSAYQLFFRQRAAMYLLTSASVMALDRDLDKLKPQDQFDHGVFWFPPITDDPLACGPFRGVGGGGMGLGITNKGDPEHERRVVDFLMYMTSPEAGQILVDKTIEADQPLIGPMLIEGVELPENLDEKFEPFLGHGFEKLNFRGLEDEQESVHEWVILTQEFLGGRMDMDTFLEKHQEMFISAIERLSRRRGHDLDPTTEDHPPRHPPREGFAWNPFQNGLLAVLIIAGCFAAFGGWHIARSTPSARRRTITAYALLFPTFFMLGAFSYYPALSGLYHAFTEWEEGREAVFNGLANFRRLAGDYAFWQGFGNMVVLLAAGLFKATVVPFIAAELILAVGGTRLRYLFRTGFLLPLVVPAMVGLLIWQFIYDPNMGMLNNGLEALGLGGLTRNWLGQPNLALPSIIFVGFPWVGAIGLLIYMAGLMNVPQSVYEAYRLESDAVLRRILSIDIPLVRGQTRLLVILTFIGSLQDFQLILILTGGGPGTATTVPALRMYYEAFRFGHFGYGAAIGFVLFLAILCVTIVNLKVLRPAEEM